jgi:hypothetical protein
MGVLEGDVVITQFEAIPVSILPLLQRHPS